MLTNNAVVVQDIFKPVAIITTDLLIHQLQKLKDRQKCAKEYDCKKNLPRLCLTHA